MSTKNPTFWTMLVALLLIGAVFFDRNSAFNFDDVGGHIDFVDIEIVTGNTMSFQV